MGDQALHLQFQDRHRVHPVEVLEHLGMDNAHEAHLLALEEDICLAARETGGVLGGLDGVALHRVLLDIEFHHQVVK